MVQRDAMSTSPAAQMEHQLLQAYIYVAPRSGTIYSTLQLFSINTVTRMQLQNYIHDADQTFSIIDIVLNLVLDRI